MRTKSVGVKEVCSEIAERSRQAILTRDRSVVMPLAGSASIKDGANSANGRRESLLRGNIYCEVLLFFRRRHR
jgi:hypothetical protein